jgi:hypothetical protein
LSQQTKKDYCAETARVAERSLKQGPRAEVIHEDVMSGVGEANRVGESAGFPNAWFYTLTIYIDVHPGYEICTPKNADHAAPRWSVSRCVVCGDVELGSPR